MPTAGDGSDSGTTNDQKESHRIGTINKWDAPDGDWAADYDWTRFRGPTPWPVPGGWVFKTPEGGGWWVYFGDIGVGHGRDDTILDELKADDSVDDPHEAMKDLRSEYTQPAYLETEMANPDEVSMRNPEDEETLYTLKIDGQTVFSRIDPTHPDVMGSVAKALTAYHNDDLEAQIDDIMPSTGRHPEPEEEQADVDRRQEENRPLDDFL